jgi:hypothetical protein
MTLVPTLASSQPMAVPVVGSAGVGALYVRTNRDFRLSNGDRWRVPWTRSGLFVHATVARRVLLMAAGSYWPPYEDSRYPGRIYQVLGIGGGATVYPLISGPYRIGPSFRWFRQTWLDQSIQHYDKAVEGFSVALQVERAFKARPLSALVWVAPAYMRDRLSEHQGFWPDAEFVSRHNLGAMCGANLVLWEHVGPYVQFGVVEHLQTQAGIGYVY